LPNIALKWDAPFHGGFESLCFFSFGCFVNHLRKARRGGHQSLALVTNQTVEKVMKQIVIVVALAVAVAISGGCASTSQGRKFDDSYVSQIKKGVTTKAQIRQHFGEPMSVSQKSKPGCTVTRMPMAERTCKQRPMAL
jgi:hypothetical protein